MFESVNTKLIRSLFWPITTLLWQATYHFLCFGMDTFKPVNVLSGSSSDDVVLTIAFLD